MKWITGLPGRFLRAFGENGKGAVGNGNGIGNAGGDPTGRLRLELARARRHERPLSVLLLSLVPEPHEAEVGDVDKRMASVASRLGHTVRETDAAWWMREDHLFVLLLPECGTDAAKQTGTRIVRDLYPQVGGELRFGVAEFPKDGLAIKELLEHAGHLLRTSPPEHLSGRDVLGIVSSNA